MGNIEIDNPKINDNSHRRFSFSEWDHDNFKEHLSDWKIGPRTHPRAIDICAGDGAMAGHLISLGWKPENIVCVDQCVSPEPLAVGVKWIYIDVKQLARVLRYDRQNIPRAIEVYRGQFDLAVIASPEIFSVDLENIVCRFFIRRDGHISRW